MSALLLFVPCYMDQLWPRAAMAAVEILESLGHDVEIRDPFCCGQVLSNAGDAKGARKVEEHWRRAHQGGGPVLVLSASCTGHLQQHAGDVPVREFCDWLDEHGPSRYPAELRRRYAYHASCSSQRETRTASATRSLLGRVDGLEIVEPSPRDECCGFGGSFATKFPELSVRMGQDRLRALQTEDASLHGVVSADVSCLLHLRALASERMRFVHVAELIREAL